MAETKLTDLQRVQAKARYNHLRRLREQAEEAAFKASLDAGVFPTDVVTLPAKEEKKGK